MILESKWRGEERGEERMKRLYAFLIKDKRLEDLERSTKDKEFLQKLMLEYKI